MGWHGYLTLWCAALGVAALVGYARSLAGVTRAQRTTRVTGRIDRVSEPRHGSSPKDGIPVVVSFRDPSTGQEFTVTNDGSCGERIATAWTGREIGVNFPTGRPHTFRFTNNLVVDGDRGLAWPNTAVFLIYISLVVGAAIGWDWPWALVGVCGPWAVLTAVTLPQSRRDARRNAETLNGMTAVPGRVVAVLKNISTDSEGATSTSHMPVVAFTTREGAAVTAYCDSGLPQPADAYGREVVIHYSPADPADFTADLAATRRSRTTDITISILALIVLPAATVVGAVLLV